MKDGRDNKITISKRNLILSLVVVASLSVFLIMSGPLSSSSSLLSLSPSPIKQVRAQQQPTSQPQSPSSSVLSSSPSPNAKPAPKPNPSCPPSNPNKCPGGQCVNFQSDANNCGACGKVCPTPSNALAACTNGQCGFTCKQGFFLNSAGSACVSQCGTNEVPVNGRCQACTSGTTACNGVCVNTQSDVNNCGTCGRVCTTSGDNTHPTCDLGKCGIACDSGTTICSSDITACVDTSSDTSNCGACGNECASGGSCTNGVCTCPLPGEQICGAAPGACTDVSSDVNNCGACNNKCATGATCSSGSCQCPSGQTACGGACVNTQSDVNNCGACGNKCASGASCTNGVCQCPSGQTACNGECIDTQTDVNNCGACNNVCSLANAQPSCTAGSCTISSCNTGFADCDKSAANGCEANLQSDTSNCGVCGKSCASGGSCTNGACSCTTGQQVCGATSTSPGTCTDLTTNANCGVCGNACGNVEVAPNTFVSTSCVSGTNGVYACSPCPSGQVLNVCPQPGGALSTACVTPNCHYAPGPPNGQCQVICGPT